MIMNNQINYYITKNLKSSSLVVNIQYYQLSIVTMSIFNALAM